MTQRRHPALGEGLHRLSRARSRPSCASWTRSTSTRCPTTPAPPRRSASQRIAADHRDLPRARLRLRLRRLRLHGRGRGRSCARSRRPASRFIGPCSHTQDGRRREGRGQAHRDREPGVGHAGRQRRHRAHAAAQVPRPRGAREAGARSTGSTVAGARATRSCRSRTLAERVLEAAYAKRIDLFTHRRAGRARCGARPTRLLAEQPGPALPPQGDRRRRRQGPAHLRRRRRRCPALVREVLNEVKATGVGDNKNMLHRAQHRADAPQRDPDARQRRVVRRARRPRLLAADARAEAGRDLGHAGGAARRDRRGARPPGRRAKATALESRPRACSQRMEEEAERFGRAVEARLGLHLRVHRRRRPPLLHGGEHPHPGGAPRLRALLRAALHQPRRSRATPSTSTRWSRRWR